MQHGIFGDLESGRITSEEFRVGLSELIGRNVSAEECYYAIHGYVESVPQRNLDMILRLRELGYKVCLLSNTNPIMMQWAMSPEFSATPGDTGADHLYLSYECKLMKPSPEIFTLMLQGQQSTPDETLFIDDSPKNCSVANSLGIHTLCPQNNEDWIPALCDYLKI